jgi:hypothetical protein
MHNETRNCQNCKKDFTIEPEDFNFYEKIKVPPPTWCPECRMKRRMAFRNERKLFRQIDFLTGEKILSIIPPESGHLVIKENAWWGQEEWDPLEYGIEFDPSRTFFEQWLELFKKVPKPSSASTRMINSDYSANAADVKNCYLIFNSNFCEDCAYANGTDYSKNCYDVSHVQKSERCYMSFWLTSCYDTNFSVQCDECVSVWFSKNCRGCTSCYGCANLVNQSYCFFNEQLSKDEYEAKIKELNLDKWSSLVIEGERARKFWLKFPNKFMQGIKNIDVSGEYITHSKNVKKSFLVRESKDLKYVQYAQTPSSYDCMDVTLTGYRAELIYEGAVCGWGGSNLQFCIECWDGGQSIQYSAYCGRLGSELFGCVGITKQKYCILNKRYNKEDYFGLKEKIKKHMEEMPYVDSKGRIYKYGEFFPPEFSIFAYNQTILPEHFSSTKEDAETFGIRWQEANPTEYEVTLQAKNIPDSIKDITEQITKEIIQCENCKRAYRIILPEFNFLKQSNIPLPRTCVDCRHDARISQRNKSELYSRVCMCDKNNHFHGVGKCEVEFETSYAPERPEIVYCEKCYQQEVY